MKKLIPLILLLLVGCTISQLNFAHRSVAGLELGFQEFQTNLNLWYDANLISKHQFDEGTKICDGVLGEQGIVAQANGVLVNIDKLDEQSKWKLFYILGPIADALDPTNMPWISTIGNPDTQKIIRETILGLRTGINSLRLYLLLSR